MEYLKYDNPNKELLYCNLHTGKEPSADEVMKSFATYNYIKKFSKNDSVCINGENFASDNDLYILQKHSDANYYIMQFCGDAFDMEDFFIPNTYWIRIVGKVQKVTRNEIAEIAEIMKGN